MLLHAFGAFENINLSCAISSKNRQPTLNKILIKSSFHCSCIQFKCKPFISAKFYRCDFYLESLECRINCHCSLFRLRNFQTKTVKKTPQYFFFRNSTLYETKRILCTVEPDRPQTIKLNAQKMHKYRHKHKVVKRKEIYIKLYAHLRYRSS